MRGKATHKGGKVKGKMTYVERQLITFEAITTKLEKRKKKQKKYKAIKMRV
jgi:hypothetical protein